MKFNMKEMGPNSIFIPGTEIARDNSLPCSYTCTMEINQLCDIKLMDGEV